MRQPENALIVREGERRQPAVDLGAGIFMSRGVSNSYLVTTGDGDVLVNTGMHYEAPEIARRFAQVSAGPVRVIVITQGHVDHVGGWSQFTGADVATIVQRNHADVRDYWVRLAAFYGRRTSRLWGGDLVAANSAYAPPEPVPTITFADDYSFRLGGRSVALYATPGGETTDSLVVHLPDDEIVFTGNLFGPLFGHLPNLYTIRGDKIRSALASVRAVDQVLALAPEVLITGHGEPVRGAARIRAELTKLRDATEYLRERTFEGMNAGVPVHTLMREIALPPELDVPQGHGKVPWVVRAIWEEHAGWFRYESTTELYDVPASALAADLVALAGASALLERARAHLAADRPLEALHLADIVLASTPTNVAALDVELAAHRLLLERSGRENFSEVRWLEAEVRDISAALSGTAPTHHDGGAR